MTEYVKTWLALKSDRHAVTAIEYGLIAALIAVVIITSVQLLGVNLTNTFTTVANTL
jgi:pilus assembly protein Flp/PilA